MWKYLFKKTLFDYIDHFFGVLIINGLNLTLLFFLFLTFQAIESHYIIPLLLFYILQSILNSCFLLFFNREQVNIRPAAIFKRVIFPAIVFSLINFIVISLAVIALRYYFSLSNFIFYTIGFFCVWILLIWLAGFFLIIPLNLNEEPGRGKFPGIWLLKKSFHFLVLHPVRTLFLMLFFCLISLTTLILLFGLGFALLLLNNYIRILLLEESFSRENPGQKTDWIGLLFSENKKIAHRSLKNVIFPWK